MEDTVKDGLSSQTLPEVRPLPKALADQDARSRSAADGPSSAARGEADLEPAPADDKEHTGNTGNTGNTSQTTFVPAGRHDAMLASRHDHLSPDSTITDDEVLQAIQRTPRWVTRTGPALLLLAMIAYSVVALQNMSQRPDETGPGITGKTASSASSTTGSPDPGPSTVPTSLPPRGKPAAHLLGLKVERFGVEGSTYLELDKVLKGKAVTLLNLWGTWCKPCVQELPDLKNMFDVATWDEDVRFVSVHTPTDTVRQAFDDFADKMPSSDNFLVEVSAGNISAALREDEIISEDGVPITVVLDCRNEVRFHHVGGLTAADFEALRPLIDGLAAELDTPFCKRLPQKKKRPKKKRIDGAEEATAGDTENTSDAENTSDTEDTGDTEDIGEIEDIDAPLVRKAAPKPECGDGLCEQPRETCRSCEKDCGCDNDSKCAKKTSGVYGCIKDVSALKP